MREDEFDRVSRQGAAAWKSLKREKNWNDWLKVGEALRIWREWALNQAQTNKPEGKAYNMAFGEKLREYKLDDMDKGTRSRLFEVMDNLPMIEEWRRTLPLSERLKINHPNAVVRRWKAFMKPERREEEDGERKPTLRDSVVNLSEEVGDKDRGIAQLKEHIAELEAGRESTAAVEAADSTPLAEQIHRRLSDAWELLRNEFNWQHLPESKRRALNKAAGSLRELRDKVRSVTGATGTPSLADAEPAVATAAPRANEAKHKPKGKATSPRPKTTEALVWTNDAEGLEAPATKGIYLITIAVPPLIHYHRVHYLPDGEGIDDPQEIGETKDLDEAKRIAQRHHDAGKDRA
jgi:hypothetical protein